MKNWVLNLFCAAVLVASLVSSARAGDTVQYNFALPPIDGNNSYSTPINDKFGNLYGTSSQVDEMIRKAIPVTHTAFLRSLPILVEAPRFVFVHAGIRPELSLDRQSDDDLVTIRSAFYERAHLLKKYVVHGHTPVEEVKRQGSRINIDTGAYFSGRLTALRIWRNKGTYLTN